MWQWCTNANNMWDYKYVLISKTMKISTKTSIVTKTNQPFWLSNRDSHCEIDANSKNGNPKQNHWKFNETWRNHGKKAKQVTFIHLFLFLFFVHEHLFTKVNANPCPGKIDRSKNQRSQRDDLGNSLTEPERKWWLLCR